MARIYRKAGTRADGSVIVELVKNDSDSWPTNEIVEFVKTDGDLEQHVIANEAGLNAAGNASAETTFDTSALVAEVVKMLDAPAMIAKAADAVRAELGTDMSPDDVVQMFNEALAEAN